MGCHALLQGIFLIQGLNLNLWCLLLLTGGFFTMNATWEASFKNEWIISLHAINDIHYWIFSVVKIAEAPILWPPDVKNWLIRKDPDAGKDWAQEEKRTAEDEMVGWYHWFNGHEFEQTPGDSEVSWRSLACCNPWSCSRTQLRTQQQQQRTVKFIEIESRMVMPGGLRCYCLIGTEF